MSEFVKALEAMRKPAPAQVSFGTMSDYAGTISQTTNPDGSTTTTVQPNEDLLTVSAVGTSSSYFTPGGSQAVARPNPDASDGFASMSQTVTMLRLNSQQTFIIDGGYLAGPS